MSWPNWTPQPSVQSPAVLPGVQYNPEQWAQLQQQNWQQWAQWQQQYQQWQQQYGAEYQKSMNALATTALPNVGVPPPLPLMVENKPPPPPEDQISSFNTNKTSSSVGYSTMPPPTSQFREDSGGENRPNWQQNKRQYNRGNDYDNTKKQKPNWNQTGWNSGANVNFNQKPNIEELSEAEKKFDKEFAAWEEQFNKWKEQNATHPDKEQYREYEKKWESWRNSLLERREQMRRKRLNLLSNVQQTNCNFNEPPPSTRNVGVLPSISFNKPPPNLPNEPLPSTEDTDKDFLKSTPVSEAIPGLDLAENDDKEEEKVETAPSNVPDFDVISKNINSILGDQKLLNMLSMVSQNQSITPINNVIDTKSRISEQSLTINDGNQSNFQYNEHSNNSLIDEHCSNHENMFNMCESVNNFDDQTRSSFTLGPNDHDYRQENFNRSQNRFNNNNNNKNRSETMPFSGFSGHNQRFETNFTNRRFGDFRRDENYAKKTFDSEKNRSNSEKFNDEQWDSNDYEENVKNIKEKDVNEEEILFEPSNVIDYNHKPVKPVEPEVLIEPIHMFDYRHKSLNRIPIPQRPKWLSDTVKNIHEFDPLASRMYGRRLDLRAGPNFRDNRWMAPRSTPRDKPFEDRRLYNRQPTLHNEYKSEDFVGKMTKPEYESDKNDFEELSDDEMDWNNESDGNNSQDIIKNNDNLCLNKPPIGNSSSVSVEDLVMPPGRYKRPSRFVVILRGPPGSGKTHLAKLIKDKEVEFGGSAPRILSLDDYFMVEQEKETMEDGKLVKVKEMVYEYEAEMEQSYRLSLIKSFKKTITDGYFTFIIVDNINDKLKYFGEMWSFAKHNGFQVYVCQLELDKDLCTKRNVHNRTEEEIENLISGWEPTPTHHTIVDPTTFLQSCSIPDVVMEEGNVAEDNANEEQVTEDQVRSKWDNFDCSVNNLAKLDGVSKPLRPTSHQSMEQYLQLDDEWESKPTKPGQKRVRWADIEEQKQQAKMRAIGFVVGHTNWDRMMDPTFGESALTQTKYIDRIKRN